MNGFNEIRICQFDAHCAQSTDFARELRFAYGKRTDRITSRMSCRGFRMAQWPPPFTGIYRLLSF